MEIQKIETRSLKLFEKKNPKYKSLARTCVCFANAKGGKILIGIEDTKDEPPINQRIPENLPEDIRKNISELTINVKISVIKRNSANGSEYIEIKIFPSDFSVASTRDGKYFIRVSDHCKVMLQDELPRHFSDKSAFEWETHIPYKISWDKCDQIKLQNFRSEIQKSNRVNSLIKEKSDEELLKYYNFIDEAGSLTNLGVLWIGNKEQRSKLSCAPTVLITKFDLNEQILKNIVLDDFSLNPRELMEDIWSKTPEFKEGISVSEDTSTQKQIFHFNKYVIRELLVNAFVHRPYTTRGDIRINIYPDRLEIHNPGLLPLGVTPDNILHQSTRRNEYLSKIFADLNLMDREGSGYDNIYEIQLSEAKQLPVIEERNDGVTVTIKNQILNTDIIRFINKIKKSYSLTQKEIICLGTLANGRHMPTSEFYHAIQSSSDNQIRIWLGRLLEYGLIKLKRLTAETEYFIPLDILKGAPLSPITLKGITLNRLNELILSDLSDYGCSILADIRQRIGIEISGRRLRDALNKLVDDQKVKIEGGRKARTYDIF